MLSHEVDLIEKRLSRAKHPNKMFFSYANTVATIDFAKQFKGFVTKLNQMKNIMTLYFIFVLKKPMFDYNKKHLEFLE